MRKQGRVLRWDAQRGFGFIRSPDTVAEVFFHVRDYEENRLPFEGMEVTFDEIHVGGKGPRGLKVQSVRNAIQQAKALPEDPKAAILPKGKPVQRNTPDRLTDRERKVLLASLGLMVFWLTMWVVSIGLGRLPALAVLTTLAIINLLTFYIYMLDKNAAETGEWRVTEKQLHVLALVGGWPGAWFAQRVFNHKTSKTSFQMTYWATVALHMTALVAWLLWPYLRAATLS